MTQHLSRSQRVIPQLSLFTWQYGLLPSFKCLRKAPEGGGTKGRKYVSNANWQSNNNDTFISLSQRNTHISWKSMNWSGGYLPANLLVKATTSGIPGAPETSTRQKLTRKSMKTTLRDLPGTFSKGNLWTWHSTKWQITTYWYFHSKDLVKKVRKRSFALPFHNKMPSFMLMISRMLKIPRQRYPEYYTFPTIWCGAWKCEICPLIRQLTAL